MKLDKLSNNQLFALTFFVALFAILGVFGILVMVMT